MRIDLHTHTTFSDGTFTPEALVRKAEETDVAVLAVTDHDTLLGIEPAIAAARQGKVTVVPGIELSIDMDLRDNGYIHLLGLFIDHRRSALQARLEQLRAARDGRNRIILAKLRRLDMPVTEAELGREAGEGSAGRPHIAALMVRNGYVNSLKEAFDKYLKEGAPAFADRDKLNFEDACDLIHGAGGLAILAHPVSLRVTDQVELENFLLKLKPAGMDGLEVYSSFHSRRFSRLLRTLAKGNGLLISGGSDFHGGNKPGIRLGRGTGRLNIPISVYEALLHAVQTRYQT